MSNLVLIDKRVTDYAAIVNAVDVSNDAHYIVFDVFELGGTGTGTGTGSDGPFAAIQAKISELNIPAFTSVGLVQHNNNAPFYQMFGPACDPPATIMGVETADPTLQTWSGVAGFITALKTNYGIQNFDLMACALYSDANWKYVIDALTVQTGVTIRASTDDTGAAALGGDWFLESHTGVNLKDVYFTEAIEEYRGVLFWWGSDNFYTSSKRRPIKSYAVGGLQLWGDLEYGGQNNTGVDLTSGIVGICSDQYRIAALKTNGSVVAWGRPGSDADYTASATVVAVPTASLTDGVIDIVKNGIASAAIKSDGSVVIWGRVGAGAENNTGVNLSGVVNVYSGYDSFAALKHNGSVVCWGHTSYGGSTTTPLNVASSLTSGIVSVYSNSGSFAAINISGGVITWGYSTYANTSDVSNNLTSGVVAIYANSDAYAALKNNGSLVIWGDIRYGGANPGSSVSSDVIHVYPNSNPGFSALKTNGSVVGWGAGVSVPSLTNVVTICSNFYGACAALKSDGSVVAWGDGTWGGSTTSPVNVASDLSSGVIALYSSQYSFAALKSNGSVVTWGNTQYGGDSSTVSSSLTSGVVSIKAGGNAFAALKSNGSVIMWGMGGWGGNNNTSASISSGIVDIFNTGYSFAALKPTSTPSYDLSMSYYSDTDRLSILCSRDYRRTANLVTLNSNVHTLSATRSLQIFNYTMPTAKPLTMIVPDYQTAPYSLTSTITLPTSIVGSNSMLITSEIGERVNISGVGTYVNYGTYVYKVETNGTYTKTTSLTVNGTSYDLYGGDGVYSSGIALYNPTLTTPTLSNFSVSAKTYGTDTSFNLTDPSSNSPAGFTFSSSNTQVATISGRTVTVVGPGVSVITASQGGSGNFINADISASLVVGFGNVSSITRNISDGAFVIPAPLSNVLTTYGTTWNKLGADIIGKVAGDESGTSISVSADGTIVAIGARSNTSNRGTVCVYKYNDISWNQLGSDINGEASSDYSGQSVSISANGRVVAIGANMNDGSGNLLPDSGHVRIYEFNGSSWVQRGADIDGEANDDQSGISVSLSEDGSIVAIGAIMNDGSGNALSNSGHVRVYKYNSSKSDPQLTNQSLSTFGPAGWDRLGGDIDGEAVNDQSGFSVSLSVDGTIVAIGAIFNDGTSGTVDTSNNMGHVRVYRYNASKTDPQLTNQGLTTFGPAGWDRLGSDIDGEVAADQSGFSLSLSADGSTVAIGAPLYDASGVSNSGRVRVFAWNGTSWGQRGENINGVALNENVGDSVSLSADGSILSVTSFMKVINYNYSSSTNTWSQIGANVTGNSTLNISISKNALSYSPIVYLDATNSSSYNGTAWTNLGSLGGNVNISNNIELSMIYSLITPYLSELKNTGFYEYSLDGDAYYISDGVGDMYDSGNYTMLRVDNLQSPDLNYSQTTPTNITVNGKVAQVVSLGYARPLTMLGFCSQRANIGFNKRGSTGHDSAGTSTPNIVYNGTLVNGYTVYAWIRVLSPSKPTICDLYFTIGDSTTTFFSTTMNTYAPSDTNDGVSYMTMDCQNALFGTILLSKPTGQSISVSECQSVIFNLTNRLISSTGSGLPKRFDAIDNGGSFNFDGSTTSESLTIASTTLSELTYVAVVKTNLKSGWATIIDFPNDNLLFGTQNNNLSIFSPTINTTFTLTAGVWYLISVTINLSGNVVFYVNGVSVFSTTITALTGKTNTVFGIGTGAPGPNKGWNGKISSLAVYNRALTSSEIANLNNSYETYRVSLSSQGNIVAIGAREYDGVTGAFTNIGATRVYKIDTSGNYTYTIGNSAIADICGNIVLPKTVGSTTINVTQAASGVNTSKSATVPLVLNLTTTTITRTTDVSGAISKTYASGLTFSVAATSSRGTAVSYTSSDTTVATVDSSSGLVTVLNAGSVTLTAAQTQTSQYDAGSASWALTVALGTNPWSNTFAITSPAVFGDTVTYTAPVATYSPAGAITYSTTTDVSNVATINSSSGVITLVGNGTVTFRATQAATDKYASSTIDSSAVTINRAITTITRTTDASGTILKTYVPDLSFSVAATSSRGTAVSYTSSDTTVATVDSSSGLVTVLKAGSVTLTAAQTQTSQYDAGSASWVLTVALGTNPWSNTFAITSPVAFGDTVTYTAPALSLSPAGAITYSTTTDVSNVATIDASSGAITLVGAGTVTFRATTAATSQYAESYIDSSAITVNRASTTITRTTDISGTITKTYAPGLTFSVAATSSRGDGGGSAVSYTSSDTSVATVDSSSGLVTVLKAGPTTITAAQTQTSQYDAGSATWVLTVALGTNPWSNTFAITSPVAFGDTVTYTAPALSLSPAGAITYSTTTDVSNVATINASSGAITLVGAGTVTFRATTAETSQYASSTIDSSAITVNRSTTTITRTTDASGTILKTYVPDLSFSVAATSSRGIGSAVTYSSSDTTVATVDSTSGLVTVLKAGSVTLTAAQTETTQYTAGSASWALTVALGTNPWSNTFAITSPVAFGDTVTYTAPALSYSPAGAITYSTTTDVSNVATINSSSGVITLIGNGTVTFRATTAETSQYASSYIDTSVIRVNRATTTITRASDAYVDGAISKTYVPDLSFSLTATSSRTDGSAISYTSSDTTVATVDSSSGLVTVLKAGTTTITASQSTTFQYSAGSNTWDLTVALGTNPWSNTFSVSSSAVFGDTITYTAPAVTYGQGGAITYSTTTDVSNVATINASTGAITIVGYGTVTFRATTAETTQYASSSIDSSAVTINRATTTITRASDAYVGGTISKTYVPDLSFSVAATSSRGIGSAVTYTSSDTTVATVNSSSGLVTVLKAGPTTITAAQTETTQYTAGSASWALTVLPGTNAWSNTFAITSPVAFGDTVTYTAPALSYSPAGAITYSTTTDVSNVAIINSTTGAITLVGYGTVTFRATTAATIQYASSYIDSSAITVNRATTTITRRNDDYVAGVISKMYVTDLSFNVSATSSRPGETAVTYSSSDTTVATVNSTSGRVTVLKAGTATITASQTATAQYTAGSISWAFTNGLGINPWANTFSITSPVTFGDTVTYTPPVATYSPAGAITYGTTTDVSNVATIDASTGVITLVGYGTVTFTATQAETEQYDDSTIHSSVVTVNRAATTITRASDAYVSGTISKTYAPDLSFSIAATSSRPGGGGGGTAVLYSSSDTAVATVDASGRVTILSGTATGSPVTLTAYQAENAQYAYGSITWSLTVSLASNTITRGTNFADATITRTYDPTSTTFNVSASSDNSATDIVFTSSDTNVASITRVNATTSQITINTAGSIAITASQSASNKYAAALDVSCALVINRRIATFFRSAPYTSSTISKYYDSAAFYLAASSVSDGAVTYESSNTNVATIDSTSGEVILYSLGSTTITASQANSSRYTTPINISWALDISSGNTTITGIPTDISKNITNVPFYLAASSASSGAITYSLTDPSSNVATVNASSGFVTLLAPGTFTVVVSQAGTTLYNAPTSVSSTITVSGAGNILENVVVNPAIQNFVNVDLSGASLAGSTLSGVSFNGASLAGASLVGATAVGTSFVNANLTNVNFSGANISGADFTNANISGTNISDLELSTVQKLQLLKNTNNREISDIQIPEIIAGDTILSVIPQNSEARQVPNIATATFKVIVPYTSTSSTASLLNTVIDTASTADGFYLPLNTGEYFKINGIKYYIVGTTIKNFATNATVEVITNNGIQYRLFVGSVAGVALQANTLSTSTFVVPSVRLIGDTSPIYTTTLPTSNSDAAAIVYSSNNPSVATIDSSGGQITMVSAGSVTFTASQAATLTYASGSKTSNQLTIYSTQVQISFNVSALDSTLQMDLSGSLPKTIYQLPASDATSVFYVKLSDMKEIFKFQTDSFDVNDASLSDVRYYVYKNKWPSTIKLNPAHSMIDVGDSTGMMGSSGMFAQNKALLKHDYVRYLAYKLFRTIHGVDLFKNESDLLENLTYWGETIRNEIEHKLDLISTTSSDETMPIDGSGNRFLTNEVTTNTNIARELMMQIVGNSRARLFDISGTTDIQTIPLVENDSFNILITVFAAENQNILTGSDAISSRTYNMKVVLKNDITGLNVPVIDSEMFPNAYPYSGNVAVITADSSANYVDYSPPVAVPVARYGFNGWYYKNTSAWVTVDPTVRNKIKWSVSPNTVSSKVCDLQYIRCNLKAYNKTSLPYITIYTASSKRTYLVSNSADMTNNGKYTLYVNFGAYDRLPAVIDHTNKELTVSGSGALTQGSFGNNETITRIALETDNAASYDAVEFTMSCIVVGETSGEKEHWVQGVIA